MKPSKFEELVAISAIVLLTTGGISRIAAMLIYYGGASCLLFDTLYRIELISGAFAILAMVFLAAVSAIRLRAHLKEKKA